MIFEGDLIIEGASSSYEDMSESVSDAWLDSSASRQLDRAIVASRVCDRVVGGMFLRESLLKGDVGANMC